MFLDIPLTTWLLYFGLALLQIYWSLAAIFNTFDSYLGFKMDVRKLIAERDGLKRQAEDYAERLSQSTLCLGVALAANEYFVSECTTAKSEARNQKNRADGLEHDLKSARAAIQMWRERAEKRNT